MGARPLVCQFTRQVIGLGTALVPVTVAWIPAVTLCPGGIVRVQSTLRAVTFAPDRVICAPHEL